MAMESSLNNILKIIGVVIMRDFFYVSYRERSSHHAYVGMYG